LPSSAARKSKIITAVTKQGGHLKPSNSPLPHQETIPSISEKQHRKNYFKLEPDGTKPCDIKQSVD